MRAEGRVSESVAMPGKGKGREGGGGEREEGNEKQKMGGGGKTTWGEKENVCERERRERG